jgi:hypothetical protein
VSGGVVGATCAWTVPVSAKVEIEASPHVRRRPVINFFMVNHPLLIPALRCIGIRLGMLLIGKVQSRLIYQSVGSALSGCSDRLSSC